MALLRQILPNSLGVAINLFIDYIQGKGVFYCMRLRASGLDPYKAKTASLPGRCDPQQGQKGELGPNGDHSFLFNGAHNGVSKRRK